MYVSEKLLACTCRASKRPCTSNSHQGGPTLTGSAGSNNSCPHKRDQRHKISSRGVTPQYLRDGGSAAYAHLDRQPIGDVAYEGAGNGQRPSTRGGRPRCRLAEAEQEAKVEAGLHADTHAVDTHGAWQSLSTWTWAVAPRAQEMRCEGDAMVGPRFCRRTLESMFAVFTESQAPPSRRAGRGRRAPACHARRRSSPPDRARAPSQCRP